MRGITDESLARLWPGRRRWHPWVSFPSLKASPSVSPSPSLAWCWQLSPGESLDLVLGADPGCWIGTMAVSSTSSLCWVHRARDMVWLSHVALLWCSPLHVIAHVGVMYDLRGDFKTTSSSGQIGSCHPLAISFRH